MLRTESLRSKLAEWNLEPNPDESDFNHEHKTQPDQDERLVRQLQKLPEQITERGKRIGSSQATLPSIHLLNHNVNTAQAEVSSWDVKTKDALVNACLHKWKAHMLKREAQRRREEATAARVKASDLQRIQSKTADNQELDEVTVAQMQVEARERKAGIAFGKACMHEWRALTLKKKGHMLRSRLGLA